MEEVLPAVREEETTLRLHGHEIDSFREILRQQLLGDQELLRDAVAGREDPEIRLQVYDRISLVKRLFEQVGMPEIIERRRAASREKGYIHIPIPWLWCLFGVIVSTGAVYTVYHLGLGPLPVFYVPVVSYAVRHYGRRAGVITTLLSALAYLLLAPTHLHHVERDALTLVVLVFSMWLIRRDTF